MTKGKAAIVTTIVSVILVALIWLAGERAIHLFNAFEVIFAVYGLVRFIMDFYHWLIKPEKTMEDM